MSMYWPWPQRPFQGPYIFPWWELETYLSFATPPPNRQPVTTEVQTFQEEVIRDAIAYELRRGGQVFFVHNRVGEIDSIANFDYEACPRC